ncbi:YqaA family protein [Burkholderia diffusa]|uniref:YqaA family protein n=1 Tax=Burkholderia diffusa TaxID=488732 RepID=UPI00158C1AFE|nr:VTT domain-containing protein [Burkholderia diffusa]
MTGYLAPLADRYVFPALAGIIAFGATVTMSIPLVPVVSAMVALKPSRWIAIVVCAVLGSATGAALLAYVIETLSLPWLNERIPELMNSRHWQHLVDWVARYGWWALAGIAASPMAQTPALALAGMLGMPLWLVFLAVALGKTVKYTAVGCAIRLALRSGDSLPPPT